MTCIIESVRRVPQPAGWGSRCTRPPTKPSFRPPGSLRRSLPLALAFAVALTAALPAMGGKILVIEETTVVSPERERPLSPAFVVIRDGRIRSLSQTRPSLPSAGEVQVVSGRGLCLIPGLIDSHVHLAKTPGMAVEHRRRRAKLARAFFKQQPRSYLYFGFTTLIDLSTPSHPRR